MRGVPLHRADYYRQERYRWRAKSLKILKTTLATALAVRASRDSRRVCIVDLDPQESTQIWHGRGGNPAAERR